LTSVVSGGHQGTERCQFHWRKGGQKFLVEVEAELKQSEFESIYNLNHLGCSSGGEKGAIGGDRGELTKRSPEKEKPTHAKKVARLKKVLVLKKKKKVLFETSRGGGGDGRGCGRRAKEKRNPGYTIVETSARRRRGRFGDTKGGKEPQGGPKKSTLNPTCHPRVFEKRGTKPDDGVDPETKTVKIKKAIIYYH